MRHEELAGARVYLLSGEEFQRSERFREILDAAVDPATRDFNMDVFTPENFDLGTFSEIIVTFPMMAERRVVALRDFDGIHPETRKKIAATVKDTPDTTLVVIEGEKASLTPKPPEKYLRSEAFKVIYENQMPSWIQGRFAAKRLKIKPDAVALMINNVGVSLRDLNSEIEKISVSAAGRDTLTVEDVARFVGEFRRDTVWNLCNAIGLGDFEGAVSTLIRLMESEKNKETFYIYSISAHIMKIGAYNYQRRMGTDHNEAMKVLTTSPYLWKLNDYDRQVRNFPEREVRRALTILTRAESSLKKSSQNKELTMELMLPLLMRPKRSKRA